MNFIYAFTLCVFFNGWLAGQSLYRTDTAFISFKSDAPLEIIQAETNKCQGILDVETGKFAFKISINSFLGFNNSLQRVHFIENYMESKTFPDATFTGRLVEPLSQTNTLQKLRAKGDLSIHGISNEIIIYVDLLQQDDSIIFESDFVLELQDYNIDIPIIVKQKIAEKIQVHVNGKLLP